MSERVLQRGEGLLPALLHKEGMQTKSVGLLRETHPLGRIWRPLVSSIPIPILTPTSLSISITLLALKGVSGNERVSGFPIALGPLASIC